MSTTLSRAFLAQKGKEKKKSVVPRGVFDRKLAISHLSNLGEHNGRVR
jgi:hypothetical protein